ncbi:MAG: F0F1 ATP synthase subunit B [Firmicutes bacterium]|nr:F0F1 ATP synthase subunit B [Candidatus Colimorpha enterica]
MEVQTLDIISVNIWNILVSLANLVILYLIIKKLLFKPVKNIIEQRKKAVQDIYDEADAAKTAAEADKALYAEKLEKADDEANEIILSARAKAKTVSENIISDANAKAAQAMRRADESIELDKRRAVNEMKDEISGLSVDIAEKMIGREINADDHKELIDSFIDSIN